MKPRNTLRPCFLHLPGRARRQAAVLLALTLILHGCSDGVVIDNGLSNAGNGSGTPVGEDLVEPEPGTP